MKLPHALWALLGVVTLMAFAHAELPTTSYIFPAGGQRGTKVEVRVGGHYLHERAAWIVDGEGISASKELALTEKIWFEGPVIKLPASQQSANYPQDYLGEIAIASDAALGPRLCRVHNAQGVTTPLPFIVGDLPEVVEQEIEGRPIPVEVALPVTINGRIFPREDVDAWTFHAVAGQAITCSVAAQELGSPLEAQLEIRDPQGRIVAESANEFVRFVAKESGAYEARITDSRFAGLQHYVYRLTITADAWADRVYPLGGRRGTEAAFVLSGQKVESEVRSKLPDVPAGIMRHSLVIAGKPLNPLLLDIDELEEVFEPASSACPTLPVPGVANGRIQSPGDRDGWSFTARQGVALNLEVRAARLGSPLDCLLVIKDASGKELAKADDLPSSPDAEISFTPPSDGTYTVEVSEKFASRGGEAFAYRLRIVSATPDFRLGMASDAIGVDAGGEKKVPITVERMHGFKGPIKLALADAPAGLTIPETVVAPNQNRVELTIKAASELPVQLAQLKIVGSAEHEGQVLERRAVPVASAGMQPSENLLCAITLPTPFRFRGDYEFRYIPRGGVMKKTFRIERNGYEGPLEVRLADRQGRHLQGVTGPTIEIAPDQDEFEYPLALAPWMELGRTSRTNLMLTGEVADAAGIRHKVSFATTEQNEQLIALVSPSPLRLSLPRTAWTVAANSEVVVPVQIHRDRSLTGPLKIELMLPGHVRDISAASLEIGAGEQTAELRLKVGQVPGPFAQPLVIRGTTDHHGEPMVAETPLELIPAR